ncbi:MAG: hypothetical protein Q7Q71_03485 [Verrucomicrobiota bacterium JB023]|nr:hypothetical protein [Verrucomicrobiota bacterium JB023]
MKPESTPPQAKSTQPEPPVKVLPRRVLNTGKNGILPRIYRRLKMRGGRPSLFDGIPLSG